jgi:hypothetical protein
VAHQVSARKKLKTFKTAENIPSKAYLWQRTTKSTTMHDFFSINRNALIMRPKPALIDWVNSIFPDAPVSYDDLGKHDSLDIFLIPDFDSVDESLEWVKENCEDFLSYALEDWCADEKVWPQPLEWELLESLFDYSIQTVVVDTMDEGYDEEEEDEADIDFDFEDN